MRAAYAATVLAGALLASCGTLAGLDGYDSVDCPSCGADAEPEAISDAPSEVSGDAGPMPRPDSSPDADAAPADVAPSCDAGAPAPLAACPADMVRLEPGSFTSARSGLRSFAKPFCVDRTEVTAAAFEKVCTSCGGCDVAKIIASAVCYGAHTYGVRPDHPVNCVTADEARAHCARLGRRLLTESEWEYAARGAPSSGEGSGEYPWGDTLSASDTTHVCWKNPGPPGAATCAVASFPAGASAQGVVDLAGNVEEWTASTESSDVVVRGGSWAATVPDDFGNTYGRGSAPPGERTNQRGFRCGASLL